LFYDNETNHKKKQQNENPAIPAHLFNPLDTSNSNFASGTIFQENETIIE
jgi:hypothetical protein